MDIAFFDPDRSHADHLRAALEATVAADARRAARYAADIVNANVNGDDDDDDDDDVDDCCHHRLLWPRGATPDDVRAAYDDRLDAAMRELREATAESEEEGGGCVQPLPRVVGGGAAAGGGKGWERKGELVTPPSSGDEGEGEGRLGKRKRGCGGEEEACEGGGAKRMRVDTDVAR
ncbi:hypothetical protein SLS58_003144 [Diplodia intermedia]|uniref:Uncharacterized protein n=1 Tax=Diplodia intermedia TaxID=856260 RepID=A0ABR3TXB4_9PEZI